MSYQPVLNKARKDKFDLILTLPKCFKNININKQQLPAKGEVNLDSLQFSIYGSPVPDIAVPEMQVPFSGQTPRLSSHTREAYEAITVNFAVDNQYKNYWYLWKWLGILNDSRRGYSDAEKLLRKIYDPSTTATNTQLEDYSTKITIVGYDEYNKETVRFDYFGSFITKLGRIDYNHRDGEEVNCNFSFVFSQMDVNLVSVES